VGPDNVRHSVVRDGTGIEHVIGTGDNVPYAFFHIERYSGLPHYGFKALLQHVLKAGIPEVSFVLDLRHGAYRDSFTHLP
jgi:hypothetical protein